MKAKVIVPVAIVALAIGIALMLLRTGRELEPTQPEPVPPAVRTVEAMPGPVRLLVHAQGTVEPRTQSELVPEVSGNVVWKSPGFVAGGYFEAGEALLRIDDRDYVAAVRRAESTLARSEAEAEYARIELERAEDLRSRSLISQAEHAERQRTARVAAANLDEARIVLESAQLDLARTELRAPFTGLVRSEQADIGQFVTRGNAVASIYATDYVEVRLPIADRQLAYLNVPLTRRGDLAEETAPRVTLSADFAGTQQTWTGRLTRMEAEIDPGSRMVYAITRVAATPDGEGTPPVGLFVQAEIEGLAEDGVVVLPRTALRDGNRVLIVDADDRLRFRDLALLRVYRDEIFVERGLKAGERVVVSPMQTVVEGMRVRPAQPES